MAKLKTTKWDSAEYLKTDEDIVLYLEACLEEDDPALVMHALGAIARARGMTQVARRPDSGAKVSTRHFHPRATRNFPTR